MDAWVRCLGAVMFACAAGMASAAPPLRLVTEHGPPTNMRVGKQIVGIGTDKLREAMARTGMAYSIELMPWKLAYSFALSEPATCVYSTARSPEREAKFKWVGPIHEIDWTLFARADRHLTLSKLEDARGLRIGTYKGDVPEEFLRGKGYIVDSAADGVLNPGKLLAGRIDLWVTDHESGTVIASQNGWADQIVPVLTFKQSELFLACNRAVPDATIERLNTALKTMQADGTYEAINRKYTHWDALIK